ncbi:unnamed protein product [uncultured bacterium]|nr:unnamed protein product [uncultured bacterium]
MLANPCERSEAEKGNQPVLGPFGGSQERREFSRLVNFRLRNFSLHEIHSEDRVFVRPALFQPVVENCTQLPKTLVSVGRSHAGKKVLDLVRGYISKQLPVERLGNLA